MSDCERFREPLRVIAVDDHPSVLAGLRHFLGSRGDIEYVGGTSGPEEAVRLVRELRPDVVVLDLRLGEREVTGVEACREMKSLPEAPRVVIHSGHGALGDVLGVVLAGADAYLHKSADLEELPEMIREVCAGGETSGTTPTSVFGYAFSEAVKRAREVARRAPLTEREWEVFTRMYRGHDNDRIADDLQISSNTVKTHVRRVLKKLEAENRRELFG